MNHCINCEKRPSFQYAFKEEYLSEYVNRFCKKCILEFDRYHDHFCEFAMTGKLYKDKIFCEHCKDNDYAYNMKVCMTCDVAFCTDCCYFHIFLHYKKCNEKFKQNINPMFEGLISHDVIKNVLMEYIEM